MGAFFFLGFFDALAGPACRVSPRRASYLSLLRQRKVTERKASRIRRPAAPVRCVARVKREPRKLAALKHARLLIRLPLRYSPPHNGGESRIPKTTRTRCGASFCEEVRRSGNMLRQSSLLRRLSHVQRRLFAALLTSQLGIHRQSSQLEGLHLVELQLVHPS